MSKHIPYAVHCIMYKIEIGQPLDMGDMQCAADRAAWRDFDYTDMQLLEEKQACDITFTNEPNAYVYPHYFIDDIKMGA